MTAIYREVKALQEDLKENGFYGAEPTGRYDQATHDAIKALVASGKLGDPVPIPDPTEDAYGKVIAAVAIELRYSDAAAEAIRTAYSEWAREVQNSKTAAVPAVPAKPTAQPAQPAQPAIPEAEVQKAVMALEVLLSRTGFLTGEPDGVYGADVETAFGNWATATKTTIDEYLAMAPGPMKRAIKVARDAYIAAGGQAAKPPAALATIKPPVEAPAPQIVTTSAKPIPSWILWGGAALVVGGVVWWFWRKRKTQTSPMGGDIDEDIPEEGSSESACPCKNKG